MYIELYIIHEFFVKRSSGPKKQFSEHIHFIYYTLNYMLYIINCILYMTYLPKGPADLRSSFLSTSSSDDSDEREEPALAVRET